MSYAEAVWESERTRLFRTEGAKDRRLDVGVNHHVKGEVLCKVKVILLN